MDSFELVNPAGNCCLWSFWLYIKRKFIFLATMILSLSICSIHPFTYSCCSNSRCCDGNCSKGKSSCNNSSSLARTEQIVGLCKKIFSQGINSWSEEKFSCQWYSGITRENSWLRQYEQIEFEDGDLQQEELTCSSCLSTHCDMEQPLCLFCGWKVLE